jgi:hypothetical protein
MRAELRCPEPHTTSTDSALGVGTGSGLSATSSLCVTKDGPAGRGVSCWGSFHVVTGAFAEPVGHDADNAFTVMTTRATLERACQIAGFDEWGARLLRLGENAMFRLAQPIVVRIARTAAYEPDARKEVAVARWLETEGYPAVRALPIDQPLVIDDRVVTFWEAVPNEEAYGTPAEVAGLLVRLHALTPPVALGLEPLRPFARAERRIEQNGWFSPRDRSFLRDRLEALKAQYRQLQFALPPGVARYDTKLWMRDLMEGAAYLPK